MIGGDNRDIEALSGREIRQFFRVGAVKRDDRVFRGDGFSAQKVEAVAGPTTGLCARGFRLAGRAQPKGTLRLRSDKPEFAVMDAPGCACRVFETALEALGVENLGAAAAPETSAMTANAQSTNLGEPIAPLMYHGAKL